MRKRSFYTKKKNKTLSQLSGSTQVKHVKYIQCILLVSGLLLNSYRKFGDSCKQTEECGFDRSICDSSTNTCQCQPEYPVTNHINKCGKGTVILLSTIFKVYQFYHSVLKNACTTFFILCLVQ